MISSADAWSKNQYSDKDDRKKDRQECVVLNFEPNSSGVFDNHRLEARSGENDEWTLIIQA